MRRLAWLLLLALAGCKRTPAPTAAPVDAGASLVRAEPSSIPRDLREADAAPDAARLAIPPLPTFGGDLELVAVGKRWGSKILSLTVLGDHVWLSGVDLDAHADGDGPLAKGPDPLAKLPYDAKKNTVKVVGRWPKLFALRTKDVNGRMESPEPTVFVRHDEAWVQARPLAKGWFPHAFVGWNDGALVVDSQIQLNAMPYHDGKEPGTTFQLVGADGSVTNPKLPIDRTFLAWTASSDGTTLSVLGTLAGKGLARDTPEGPIAVFRGKPSEPFATIRLFENANLAGMETYQARVQENGASAVVFSSYVTVENVWKSDLGTMYVASGSTSKKRVVPMPNDMCGYEDATIADGVVFAIRRCITDGPDLYKYTVLRVPESGPVTEVRMPLVAKADEGGFRAAKAGEKGAFACGPKKLAVRGPGDLWMVADCGKPAGSDAPGIPAVFRLGRAQTPVVIP